MQEYRQLKRHRARWIIFATVVLLALGGLIYWTQHRQKRPPPAGSSQLAQVFTVPPFATKEPERYQATRISTSSNMASGSDATQASSSRILIARDGAKRREDYDLGGFSVSYLELPPAHYALLPSQKIYADLNNESGADRETELPPEFSPDRLLNQSLSESRYEVVGSEVVNGRATTRFRVTSTNVGEPNSLKSETLIWVDQSLGLPIRSETTIAEEGSRVKFTTQLQNITENVDSKLFELPVEFRKVSYGEFERQLRRLVAGK
ncbi:MAG: hypothetical protein ABJC05_11960 [Pyrinomonadaceae bacterium]